MGLIKKDNVRSDYTFLAVFTSPPRFEKQEFPGGEDREPWTRVDYAIDYRELYPVEGTEDRKLAIRLSGAQAEAILEEREPRMHPRSSLGQWADDASQAGLQVDVDDDDLQGIVAVITRDQTPPNDKGYTNTIWRFRAVLGNREKYDEAKGQEIVDRFNEGTKAGAAATEAASF